MQIVLIYPPKPTPVRQAHGGAKRGEKGDAAVAKLKKPNIFTLPGAAAPTRILPKLQASTPPISPQTAPQDLPYTPF